jgi:hypothetical protein
VTTYFVDDGGSDTSPYDTWAKAATSLRALQDAIGSFANGDLIYVGHDHADPTTHTGNLSLGLPSYGNPVMFVSATAGSSPPVYAKAVSHQVDMTDEHWFQANGSVIFQGLQIRGLIVAPSLHQRHDYKFRDCKIIIKDQGQTFVSLAGVINYENTEFDFSEDSAPVPWVMLTLGITDVWSSFRDCKVTGASNRTGVLFQGNSSTSRPSFRVSGMDVTSVPSACEIVDAQRVTRAEISNLLTGATWVPYDNGVVYENFRPAGMDLTFVNCGPANAPTSLIRRTVGGELISTTDIYRSGGAAIDEVPFAWLVSSSAEVAYGREFALPYVYGEVEAGSKTFTVHITNDAGDLTEADIYLEVEFLSAAGEPLASLAHDGALLPTSSTLQTDDTTSVWNGTGPSFTYKQKLAVTATVAEAGLYRARVSLRKSGIASSAYLYIDPKVVVS